MTVPVYGMPDGRVTVCRTLVYTAGDRCVVTDRCGCAALESITTLTQVPSTAAVQCRSGRVFIAALTLPGPAAWMHVSTARRIISPNDF